MDTLLKILEGVTIGALAAISIIYTFQTRVPYPKWVLQAYDKPWVFLLLLVVGVILLYHSPAIGALVLLLLGAVWIDGLLFARSFDKETPVRGNDANIEANIGKSVELWPFVDETKKRLSDPELYGPSLDMVPLPEPIYPVFYGLNDTAIGAATFE